MVQQKHTKKALLASGLSLLACVALLLGSTFAWFTDSVTSGSNRIEAGNLEIDLLMDKEENGTYTTIADGTGDIFSEATGNGTLWEPNKTEIVYLAVANKGNLAVNYNIELNVRDYGLADALQYAVLDGAKATDADVQGIDSWDDVLAVEGVQTGNVQDGRIVAAPNGRLEVQDQTDYFALAVHMDKDAGNQYMDKSIEIDVTVVAKQAVHEEDSFGPDYDAQATMPVVYDVMATPDTLTQALAGLQDGDTLYLAEGVYEPEGGVLAITQKNITIIGDGADKTIVKASVRLGLGTMDNAGWSLRDLSVVAPAGNTQQSGVYFDSNLKLSGGSLQIEGCEIADFQYGVSVASSVKDTLLNVKDTTFARNFCGMSVKTADNDGTGNAGASTGNRYQVSGVAFDSCDYALQTYYPNTYYTGMSASGALSGKTDGATAETDRPQPGKLTTQPIVDGVRYDSLSDALTAAANEGTVELPASFEATGSFTVSGNVTIEGNGAKLSSNTTGQGDYALLVAADGATIRGIEFTSGSGIQVQAGKGNLTIDGCVFPATLTKGLYISGGTEAPITVQNCEIAKVNIEGANGAIAQNVTFQNNTVSGYDGTLTLAGKLNNVKILDNRFVGLAAIRIYSKDGLRPDFSDVVIQGNTYDVSLFNADDPDGFEQMQQDGDITVGKNTWSGDANA